MYRDFKSARERFIEELIAYKKKTGHEITVVFDGWKGGSSGESAFSQGGVHVVYSRLSEKADAVIKRLLSMQSGQVLVSSDRELEDHAWACGCTPVGSSAFLRRLAYRNAAGGAGTKTGYDRSAEGQSAEEEADQPSKGKGRSRPPSKKQKAVMRALERL